MALPTIGDYSISKGSLCQTMIALIDGINGCITRLSNTP